MPGDARPAVADLGRGDQRVRWRLRQVRVPVRGVADRELVAVVRVMLVQIPIQRAQSVGRGTGVARLGGGVSRPEHAHQVPVRLFEPRPPVVQIVVNDVWELGRERIEPRQAPPLAALEQTARRHLGELHLIGLGLVQRQGEIPVPDSQRALAAGPGQRLVRLADLRPLARGQRAVVPLHLVHVQAAIVCRHHHVDATVALPCTAPGRADVASAQQHGDDGFHVLAGPTDQRAWHAATSPRACA